MQEIHLIVAMTPHGVIGNNNGLPWKLPSDLRRFREVTMGHPVIMGSRTFLGLKRRLEGRTNIVITRNNRVEVEQKGGVAVSSPEAALVEAGRCSKHPYIIGGAEIYRRFLPQTKVLHLTNVQATVEGDITLRDDLNIRQWGKPQEMLGLKRHDPHDQYHTSYAVYRRH